MKKKTPLALSKLGWKMKVTGQCNGLCALYKVICYE
jgi:hypothetical protein